MSKFTVTINGVETSYSQYVFTIEAKSLKEAEKKAKKLAEDNNGDFADKYYEYCDPGDSYTEFTVDSVEEE